MLLMLCSVEESREKKTNSEKKPGRLFRTMICLNAQSNIKVGFGYSIDFSVLSDPQNSGTWRLHIVSPLCPNSLKISVALELRQHGV